MENKKLRRLNIFRGVSYFYYILVCVFWLLDNGFPGYINWPILTIATLLTLQALFKAPVVDGILGFILAMLSLYMMLAVTSDVADHFNGTKPVKSIAQLMGFGYGIFGLTLLSAISIIYIYFVKEQLNENKQTMQSA